MAPSVYQLSRSGMIAHSSNPVRSLTRRGDDDGDGSDGIHDILSGGAIAAIIVVVLVALSLAGFFCLWRKRKRRGSGSGSGSGKNSDGSKQDEQSQEDKYKEKAIKKVLKKIKKKIKKMLKGDKKDKKEKEKNKGSSEDVEAAGHDGPPGYGLSDTPTGYGESEHVVGHDGGYSRLEGGDGLVEERAEMTSPYVANTHR